MTVLRRRVAKRILLQLDAKKATGADGLPARVLKECASELALQALGSVDVELEVEPVGHVIWLGSKLPNV